MMHPKQAWPLLKQAVKAWSDDYAPSMGAALSYYTLFSIAPLLLIVIAVAGWLFGDEAVRGELVGALTDLMGEDGAKAIEGLLAQRERARRKASSPPWSACSCCCSARPRCSASCRTRSTASGARRRARPSGVWRLLRSRLLSLRHDPRHRLPADGLAGVRRGAAGARQDVGHRAAGRCSARCSNLVVSFGLTTVIFAMIYKLMPRAQDPVARRLGRRRGHRGALRDRQVPHRPVHRHAARSPRRSAPPARWWW